jgi:hypothetical protein
MPEVSFVNAIIIVVDETIYPFPGSWKQPAWCSSTQFHSTDENAIVLKGPISTGLRRMSTGNYHSKRHSYISTPF